MSDLPPSLLECLRLRQAVLVAGARCAELADLPRWQGLAERLVDWVDDTDRRPEIAALIAGGRTLAALGALRAEVRQEAMVEVVVDAFPGDRPLPAPLVEATRIPWRGVITTGLDDLWPRALASDDPAPTALLPGQELLLPRLRGRFVLSLLGGAPAPDSLCIGAHDLASKVAAGPTAAWLAEAHRRWSFVFVGFARDDPDRVLLERLLGASGSAR